MRTGSVLVVGDDEGTGRTLGDALRARGFTVETAGRGSEGLESLLGRPFDAAVVDIKSPDVSGRGICRALKESAPDAEVIFIAGRGSLVTAIEAIEGDAFAYVAKPVEMEHLIATLEKALEKQALTRALRESEERYRLIAETIMDAVVLLDLDGRLLYQNARAEQISGYPRDELLGRSILPLLTPEGVELIEARRAATRRGEDVPPVFEAEVVRKDGTRVWVEATATDVVRNGRAVGRLGVVRDISERKRASEEIQRQRDALHQTEKLAAMGELLAGVAHELNNPLSVVTGYAAIISKAADGRMAERAGKLLKAAERCARIVKNFLALARRRTPQRERIDVNQVVVEALDLLAYPLRVHDVEVMLDLSGDLPTFAADPHQLHQVVVNLVSNAHQAMREQPAPRRITISTRPGDHGRILLEVQDTGPGIRPEIHERVFEPFFTTKPPGEGTGLGLSLCQSIIEAHGGTIRIASEPGRGAAFRIELPADDAGTPAPPPVEPETPLRGRTILVVDDEPEIAGLLTDMLATDGHRVEVAANGLAALDKLRERSYDLILSDLRMPELDGPGLYREMERHHPELLGRMLFITGDLLGPDARAFLERAGAPLLSKPFAFDEVHRVVQRALRALGAT